MRLTKLIKEFSFEEEHRDMLTIGSKTRLNGAESCIQLKEQGIKFNEYPLDADLSVSTWIANPDSVRQWLAFQVEQTPGMIDKVVYTSLGYKLSDGTDERFWNGSNWVVAASDDWNTETEISAHIGAFPVTTKKIGVVVNLVTTDKTLTPKVRSIKIAYDSDIQFKEDILHRSLIRKLKTEIRPRARHVFKTQAAISSIDLKTVYKIETPYNVASVENVYNHTDDPNHVSNLYVSFNPTTMVVLLSGSIPSGKQVWIDFLYEPEVAITTGQEYHEVERVPCVILDDINLVDCNEQAKYDSVINLATGTGWLIAPPLRGTLEVRMKFLTDKSIDLMRLSDEINRFFANNPTLQSVGMDEKYRIWQLEEFTQTTTPNKRNIQTGELTFRIVDVLFFLKDAVPAYGVQTFNLSLTPNTI